MPPKKGKKTAPSKAPAKRTTRAAAKKASDDKSAAADGAVKDATIIKPATPPKPATGEKRKRTDGADEEDSSSSGTKKPKLSPKSAERVRVEEYLKIRVKDLGFNVDPVKGHDDNEDEDEPDEHWTSIQRMRQRCDDRLDEIEEAIRTIGRSLKSGLVIPEHKSDETRHEKRQKHKDIKDDQEIDPIAESKTMKVRVRFVVLICIMTAAESTIYYTRNRADCICEYRSPKLIPTAKNTDQQRSWETL